MIKEYGKICQSCFIKKEARLYFRPVLGFKGKNKHIHKFRRLCNICWDRANENQI